jgi:hypothetical protein
MRFSRFTELLLVVSLNVARGAGFAELQRPAPTHGHLIFRADDDSFEPSVTIPPRVLTALVKTHAGRDGLEFASAKGKPVIADLFRAVEVSLGAPDDPALVVGGVGRMSGADNDWFWIVQAPRRHPRIILWCGANSLEILATASDGHKDVRCTWYSASEKVVSSYRYAAGRYRLKRERWSNTSPTAN